MHCLDANIWIYYLDAELAEHEMVRDPISSLLADEPLFMTTVLQMEVVHYLRKQLAESQTAIDRFLNIEDTKVTDLTEKDVAVAADLLDTHSDTGIGGRDATVVAAMDRHGICKLWTHDTGLKRLGDQVDWLTVSDPVE
ncbi:type II toxin-antitoxin system VapC family toxin [Haloarcula halophila]|uniref:type II toxin-antitoxin system VapC family toxin n=1 Tax=Haloarcula TaxID=2237 RepID=UPI0023E3837C|nr:type II toxin-antitoxin system VapC family toxin [Halomicroarcula sp. DFY41]